MPLIVVRKMPPTDHGFHKLQSMPVLRSLGTYLRFFGTLCLQPCARCHPAQVLIQDWWCTSLTSIWRTCRPGSWPCSPGSPANLHVVPGLGPTDCPPDQMHTWHLGVGQVLCGSTIASGLLVQSSICDMFSSDWLL